MNALPQKPRLSKGSIVRVPNPDDLNYCLKTTSFHSYEYHTPTRPCLLICDVQQVDGVDLALVSPIASGIDEAFLRARVDDFDPIALSTGHYAFLIRDDDHFQYLELCAVIPVSRLQDAGRRADEGDEELWRAICKRIKKLWPPRKRKELIDIYRDLPRRE